VEFDAILDTGFTGFVAMPLLRALPLGLMLYGTTTVEIADGSTSVKLTAKGMAEVECESKVGVVILEPSSNDVLIGMAFLRTFEKALFVSQTLVFLVPESLTQTKMKVGSRKRPDSRSAFELRCRHGSNFRARLKLGDDPRF